MALIEFVKPDKARGQAKEIYDTMLKNLQGKGVGAKLVAALAQQFNQSGIYSMLVRVLKRNPYRRFYKKINGTYLKTERLPFAGEFLELEIYGWLDTTLIYD